MAPGDMKVFGFVCHTYNEFHGHSIQQLHRHNMAAIDETASFETVWRTVRHWSSDDQRLLVSKILASLAAPDTLPGTKASPADLIGAWHSAGPADDTTVQAVLEDELMRKHL
jgi:hypothetical protein